MHIGVKKTIKILSLPILSGWQTLHILISAVALCLKAKLALGVGLGTYGFSLGLDHEGYGFGLGRKILALTTHTSLTESCVFVLFVLNIFNK